MRKQFAALSVKLDSIQKSDSTTSREQQERPPKSQSDLALEERFHYARNIQDLLKLNPNLQYDEESNVLFCPCSPQSHFQCPDMEDPDSEEEDQALVQAQARKFRNLKIALKRHLETAGVFIFYNSMTVEAGAWSEIIKTMQIV